MGPRAQVARLRRLGPGPPGKAAQMFLNILVGIDGSSSSLRALEHAVDLARASNARLTLMTGAPSPSSYVTLAGVNSKTMSAELDKWAEDVLDRGVRLVPDDVIAHTVQGRGDAGPGILKELRRGGYDLIVLG